MPEEQHGIEMHFEPNDNSTAKAFQRELIGQGTTAAVFAVEDIQAEQRRMQGFWRAVQRAATDVGPAIIALLDDTRRNRIQVYPG